MGSETIRICLSPGTLSTGGIGRNTLNLASTFLRMGHEVDIVLIGEAPGGREREIPADVNVYAIARRSRYALFGMTRYIKERRPHLIISAHHNINAVMLLAKRISGLQRESTLACTFRTYRSVQYKRSSNRGKLYDWVAFRLYKWADHLVAVSQGVADDLERTTDLPQGSVKVIHNPAWSDEMASRANELCEDKWITDSHVPVVITVGRLAEEKDYPTLLRAFHLLRQQRECRLVILGDGDERRSVEEDIEQYGLENDVRLVGHVSNPLKYMTSANLFVLASAWEGFGNVLVEALGCGLPIVSTDCPSGPREILSNGQYGTLVTVGDYVAMSNAMLSSLNDPPSPERQLRRAEAFSFQKSADEYLNLMS